MPFRVRDGVSAGFPIARPLFCRRAALRLLAATAVLASPDGPANGETIAFPKFREEVFEVVRRRFPDLPLSPGDDQEEILSGSRRVYLGNLYAIARSMDAAGREAEIVKWFDQVRDIDAEAKAREKAPIDWTTARPLLRPKLTPIDIGRQTPTLVRRAFSPNLDVGYGVDLGRSDSFVLDRRLDEWKVPLAEVEAVAIANLERMSTDMVLEPTPMDDGSGRFLIINKGDYYDASRILLPAVRARIVAALGPAVLATIPNRDLFVAWPKGMSGQDDFIATVQENWRSGPYPLSDEVFTITADAVRLATKDELKP